MIDELTTKQRVWAGETSKGTVLTWQQKEGFHIAMNSDVVRGLYERLKAHEAAGQCPIEDKVATIAYERGLTA